MWDHDRYKSKTITLQYLYKWRIGETCLTEPGNNDVILYCSLLHVV